MGNQQYSPLICSERIANLLHGWFQEASGENDELYLQMCRSYSLERHLLVARTFGAGFDHFVGHSIADFLPELSGDLKAVVEVRLKQLSVIREYIRADQLGGELHGWCGRALAACVDFSAECVHPLKFRAEAARIFEMLGCVETDDCKQLVSTHPDFVIVKKKKASSRDGLHHTNLPFEMTVHMFAALSVAMTSTRSVDRGWFDDIPDANASTWHDSSLGLNCHTNVSRTEPVHGPC